MQNGGGTRNFIIDDTQQGIFRVNRKVFTDSAILEEEKRKVFGHCWLYVGHESELPEPTSYVRRKVAGRYVIFLRNEDGGIGIFFDTCTHRGNSVCRGASGKTRLFTCSYHGWTFNTRGKLIGVPDRAGYSESFDTSQLGLVSPPRVESYRGLVFMCLDPAVQSLESYLGTAREYIDLMLDFSDSEIEIARGVQSYSMKANWKLLVENSADVYHALITHQRFFVDFVQHLGGDTSQWRRQMADLPNNVGLVLDNGHAVIETPNGPLPLSAKGASHIAEVRRKIEARHGLERTHRILDYSRNLLIFPNLAFVGNFRTIRTFYPVTPDYLEVDGWALVPRDEPGELREMRFDNFISFLGPGGFGTPDDVEVLENCQRAFSSAQEVSWSDISRGMTRQQPLASDEVQMRAFWRRWNQLMEPGYVCGEEPSKARKFTLQVPASTELPQVARGN
jgi:p-cumate 2,3-dioxygenase alpha subunit